jgi:hypothetical protein
LTSNRQEAKFRLSSTNSPAIAAQISSPENHDDEVSALLESGSPLRGGEYVSITLLAGLVMS